MRVLICDDDPLMRNVIRSVAQSAGHEVIAETDRAVAASELIGRYSPDIVVLDLALAAGVGDSVLREARAAKYPCRVVVFSAYASDPANLIAHGAAAVVEKPHFDELEITLAGWATEAVRERRRSAPPRDTGRAVVRSPSGLEEGRDFDTALARSRADDVLLMLRLDDYDALAHGWGEVIANDWVLHLARLTRGAMRDHDRLACFDGRRVHALIIGGGAEGMEAVLLRVTEAWRDDLGPAAPRFRTSYAMQEGDTPADILLKRAHLD
jgi:DNA-binding NarL/FixJ family response regulator